MTRTSGIRSPSRRREGEGRDGEGAREGSRRARAEAGDEPLSPNEPSNGARGARLLPARNGAPRS
jgi:hypothetical protein